MQFLLDNFSRMKLIWSCNHSKSLSCITKLYFYLEIESVLQLQASLVNHQEENVIEQGEEINKYGKHD